MAEVWYFCTLGPNSFKPLWPPEVENQKSLEGLSPRAG